MTPPIWLIIPLAFIAFILFWCMVCLLLSAVSGWSKLAKEYRTEVRPEGKFHHMQIGRVGMVSYNNCLTIGVTDEGLYLAVFPLFRPGHPPLLIDWSALGPFTMRKLLWATRYVTTIQIDRADEVRLEIYNKSAVSEIMARLPEPDQSGM